MVNLKASSTSIGDWPDPYGAISDLFNHVLENHNESLKHVLVGTAVTTTAGVPDWEKWLIHGVAPIYKD